MRIIPPYGKDFDPPAKKEGFLVGGGMEIKDLIFSRKTREKTGFFVSGASINQKSNFLKKHEKLAN